MQFTPNCADIYFRRWGEKGLRPLQIKHIAKKDMKLRIQIPNFAKWGGLIGQMC